jgi:hypothetical protein
MLRILFAAAMASLTGYAEAATFEVLRDGKDATVVVQGTINDGDEKVFQDRVKELPRGNVIVTFNSDGGNLYAGLVIGETIRKEGLWTLVEPRALCASVCAMAWLAGVKRGFYPTSRIGFHAAHHRDTKEIIASGNALIGAYQSEQLARRNVLITRPGQNRPLVTQRGPLIWSCLRRDIFLRIR